MSILKYIVKTPQREVLLENVSVESKQNEQNPPFSVNNSANVYCNGNILNGLNYGYCDKCGRHFNFLKEHISLFHNNKEEKRCAICGVFYAKISKLLKHLLHHESNQIYCNYCGKTGFEDFEQLNSHLEEHSYLHIYVCDVCDRGFSVKSCFEDHLISHETPWKVPILKCFKCDMCFDPRNRNFRFLTRHWLKDHKKDEMKCPDCSKTFNKLIVFYIHCLRHKNALPFKCPHCGLGFRKECRLKEHINATHLNIHVFSCNRCDAKFKYQSQYDLHIRSHDPSLQFICFYCNKNFIRKHNIQQHFLEKFCDICNEVFYCRTNFESHYDLKHKNDRLFDCSLCDKSFSKEFILKSHITKNHSENNKKLICSLCPFKTSTKRNLLRHVRRNHAYHKQSYDCKKCGETFSSLKIFRGHLNNHNTSVQQVCSYCNQLFYTKKSLIEHFNKKYCKTCGQLFFCSQELDKHNLLIHENRYVFTCSLCDKSYPLESELKRHIEIIH